MTSNVTGAALAASFQPTQLQITAAETVFLAMVMLQTIQPKVLAYQQRILSERQWSVGEEFAEAHVHSRVVTDPSQSWLLGSEDFETYQRLCAAAAAAEGLTVAKPGNCPLLEAEENLRQAKNALVLALDGAHPITLDQVVMLAPSDHERLIDLMLRLMAPFVRDAHAVLQGVMAKASRAAAAPSP